MDNSTASVYDGPTNIVKIILITIAVVIFLLAVVGNIIVCLAILYNNKSNTKCTNIFLVNLAISDLLISISIPFAVTTDVLGTFIFGDFMCKLVFSVRNLGVAISSLTLVVVAFDRYYAVYYTAKQFKKKTAIILIIILWIASCLAIVPQVIALKIEHYDMIGPVCREYYMPDVHINELAYTISLIGLFFVLPFIVIVVLHILIAKKLCTTRRRLSTNITGSRSTSRSYQQVYVMLFTVTMVFFWTLIPTYTLQFLLSLNLIDGPIDKVYTAYYITTWLGYSHVMWNPIVYGLLNSKMRRDISNMFKHSSAVSNFGKS